MKSQSRELFTRIALAMLGVIIMLVVVEVMARIFVPAPGSVQFVPDPEVGYRHTPNQNQWVSDQTGEFRARFITNSHGDPDRERSLEKPAGTFRIAVIGDSMVEAAQVPIEKRFTSLLETQLTEWIQEQPGTPQKIEVLNFGTAGFGTAQELLYYRAHVRKFNPDLVLFVFLPGNDIKNNSYELEVVQSCRPEMSPFFSLTGDQELVLVNPNFYHLALARYQKADLSDIEKLKQRLLTHIRLIDLGNRAFTTLRSGAVTTGKAAQLDQDACQTETTLELYDPNIQSSSLDWKTAWELTAAIVNQLSQEVTGDGADFQFVSVTGPWEVQAETRDLVLSSADQSKYDWQLPQRMSTQMAEDLKIANLSVLPMMQKAVQQGTKVHYKFNGHYTPAGHQILAQALLPIVQSYLTQ